MLVKSLIVAATVFIAAPVHAAPDTPTAPVHHINPESYKTIDPDWHPVGLCASIHRWMKRCMSPIEQQAYEETHEPYMSYYRKHPELRKYS